MSAIPLRKTVHYPDSDGLPMDSDAQREAMTMSKKKDLYERLGIGEYIVFDPDGEFIQPRLQGFRLERGRYRPILLEPDGSLVSLATGLRMLPEGENLRLVNTATGERYPWVEEEREARMKEAATRRAAEQQAAREAAAR